MWAWFGKHTKWIFVSKPGKKGWKEAEKKHSLVDWVTLKNIFCVGIAVTCKKHGEYKFNWSEI